MSKPVLLSSVVGLNVRDGEVCPFCGGKKTKGASSCVHCRHLYGGRSEARMAVDEALEAIEEAYKGHTAAIASDPDRDRQLIFEGFTMMELKAKKGTVEPANSAIAPYVPVGIYIDGGWFNISAFGLGGMDLRRKTWVAGVFQHKSKKVGDSTVHYGRFQYVPGVEADTELFVSRKQSDIEQCRQDLPRQKINDYLHRRTEKQRLLRGCVGFINRRK